MKYTLPSRFKGDPPNPPLGDGGKKLMALMRADPPATAHELRAQVRALYEARLLHEVSAALARPCPDSARRVVGDLYRRLTEAAFFTATGGQTQLRFQTDGSPEVVEPAAWLVGAEFSVDGTWRSLTKEQAVKANDAVAAFLNESLGNSVQYSVHFPGGDYFLAPLFLNEKTKLFLLQAILSKALGARNVSEAALDIQKSVEDQSIEQMKHDSIVAGLRPAFVTLGVVYADALKDDIVDVARLPDWVSRFREDVERVIEASNEEERPTLPGVTLHYGSTLMDAFLRAKRRRRYVSFASLKRMSEERAKGDALAVTAAPQTVVESKDHRFENLKISIWRKEHNAFLWGTSWAMDLRETMPEAERQLAEDCVSLGLPLIVHPSVTSASFNDEESLYPDMQGRWRSPLTAIAGDGEELLLMSDWHHEHLDTNFDHTGLPAPTVIVSEGWLDVIRAQFRPDVAQLYRDLCADTSLADDEIWPRLIERFPTFEALLRNASTAAIPPPPLFWTARWAWSGSPLVVARTALTERMLLTDLGLDFEAEFLVVPFPLVYLHFEGGRQDLEWKDAEGEATCVSGVFVHQTGVAKATEGKARHIDFAIIGDNGESIDVALHITDESETLRSIVKRSLQESEEGSDEEWVAFVSHVVEEIVKVFIYLGSREARVEKRLDRSTLLSGLGEKPKGKREKLLRRARTLYDYILIGPEQAIEDDGGLPLGKRRTMKPHPRRGHRHTVRYGAKRQLKRMELYPPTFINAHMLPAGAKLKPKNYEIK